MPESLQKLLQDRYLNSHNQLSSSLVCRITEEVLAKYLKKDSSRVKTLSFDGYRIKLSIEDSLISHKIKMLEEKIKKSIKKRAKLGSFDIIYSPKSNDQ